MESILQVKPYREDVSCSLDINTTSKDWDQDETH